MHVGKGHLKISLQVLKPDNVLFVARKARWGEPCRAIGSTQSEGQCFLFCASHQSVQIYGLAPKSRSRKLKYMFDITIKTQKYSRGRFYGCCKTASQGQNCYSDIQPDSEGEQGDKSQPKQQPSLCRYPCSFASRWMKLMPKTGGDLFQTIRK